MHNLFKTLANSARVDLYIINIFSTDPIFYLKRFIH